MHTNLDDLFECEFFEGDVECDEWVNAHCTIIGLKNADEIPADLEIPVCIGVDYDNYIVTQIADGAFSGLSNLRSVKIPGSVEEIGEYAFADCKNLTCVKLVINDELSIQEDAFKGCNAISEVHINSLVDFCSTCFGNEYSNPIYFAEKIYINGELMGDCLEIPSEIQSRYSDARINNFTFCGCKIDTLKFAEGITNLSIDRFAFVESEIKSVILPESLKALSPRGFLECKSLNFNNYKGLKYLGSKENPFKFLVKAVDGISLCATHPSTKAICLSAFENNSSLNELTVTEGVVSIGYNAFSNCTNLKKIYLPSTLMTVGSKAFAGCTSLEEAHIPDIASWCKIRFSCAYGEICEANPLCYAKLYLADKPAEDVVIPPEITEIVGWSFAGYRSLKSITFHDKLNRISDCAFFDCSSLVSADIPDSVQSIGRYAFYGCSSLKSVKVPPVRRLEYATFGKCSSLENVQLACGLVILDGGVFADCTALESIEIPSGVTEIGRSAFADCTSLINIKFPNTLKDIEYEAFAGCSSLRDIELPESLEDISVKAFCCCTSLKRVKFPDKDLFYLSDRAFAGCTSLEIVKLSRKIHSLLNGAFEDCTALIRIEMPDTISYIGKDIFKGCNESLQIIASEKIMAKLK